MIVPPALPPVVQKLGSFLPFGRAILLECINSMQAH